MAVRSSIAAPRSGGDLGSSRPKSGPAMAQTLEGDVSAGVREAPAPDEAASARPSTKLRTGELRRRSGPPCFAALRDLLAGHPETPNAPKPRAAIDVATVRSVPRQRNTEQTAGGDGVRAAVAGVSARGPACN